MVVRVTFPNKFKTILDFIKSSLLTMSRPQLTSATGLRLSISHQSPAWDPRIILIIPSMGCQKSQSSTWDLQVYFRIKHKTLKGIQFISISGISPQEASQCISTLRRSGTVKENDRATTKTFLMICR